MLLLQAALYLGRPQAQPILVKHSILPSGQALVICIQLHPGPLLGPWKLREGAGVHVGSVAHLDLQWQWQGLVGGWSCRLRWDVCM
jgi:hypothetical protein